MAKPSHDVIYYLRSLLHRHSDAVESDRELLRRFVERCDDVAFTALLRRHGPMVLNLARRITGDKQLAEDVFQATFLLLSQKGGTIRRPEALPCWLHGVARRLAVQTRSTQLRCQRQETRCRPSLPSNPLDELTAQEFLTVLDEELAKLPENHRAPLILCCLEGLSQEEAARRLGCSAGAIRGRLERGRQRLRLRLEKRGLTLPAVLGGTLLLNGWADPLPVALTRATLAAVTIQAIAPPAVAALIPEAIPSLFCHKLKIVGLAVVWLVLASTGVGMMDLLPQAHTKKTPPATVACADMALSAKKRMDLYGDSLPEGAAMRLGTLQRRAVGALLAVTPDGKSVVTVREGKYVRIWDADSGASRETRELPTVSPGLSALIREPLSFFANYGHAALSPNGRWLATIGPGVGTLTLWDLHTGKLAHEWNLKDAQSLGPLSFSADGNRLAAGGHNGDQAILRVWEVRSGQETFAMSFRLNCPCHCLAFSRKATYLIASYGTAKGGTYCWELATGRQVWYRPECTDSRMLLTPEDQILCPYCRPTALDVATGMPCQIGKMPPLSWDTRSAFSPDGRTLLLSTVHGTIVWDRTRGETVRTLSAVLEDLVFFPDGKSVLCNNGSLQRRDVATGQPLWADTFTWGHVDEVVALAFSADGRRLVSTSPDGTVRLWDTTMSRALRIWRTSPPQRLPWQQPREGSSAVLAISPDGRQVLSAAGERLHLWDAASDKVVRSLALPRAEEIGNVQSIYQAWISSDGEHGIAWFGLPVLVARPFGRSAAKLTDKLAEWDLRTGKLLSWQPIEWAAHAVSPDRRMVLARGRLLDTASGREIARLETLSEAVPCTFARDGSLVAGLASSARFRVWETVTGKPLCDLKTEPWGRQVLFSPKNRLIVTNDSEGVQLRRLPAGEIAARLPLPEKVLCSARGSYASSIAFSSCGRRLATGMPDGTILLWDISLPASKQQQMRTSEVESCWSDLADTDAAKAWRAVGRLAEAPHATLAFLRSRIKPYPTAAADVTRQLLADLDSDSFEVREAAVKRLKELGLQAEPALRATLKAKPSLEQRQRIESLLAALVESPPPLVPEDLQQLRALIVLEHIGTPEARRLLEDAAKGPSSARLTRQARAALACLP